MSRERKERQTLQNAVEDAVALLTGDSGTSRTFLGGMIVGALVGAAVAGASLVRSRTDGEGTASKPAPRH